MREQDEDAAWRSIVENYGERAELDDAPADLAPDPAEDLAPDAVPLTADLVDEPEWSPILDAPPERYVPPPPPPLPRPSGPRGLAWVVLLAFPVLMLVLVLTDVWVPPIVSALLGLGTLAAFGYLIWTMPTERPDPWDDGSRV